MSMEELDRLSRNTGEDRLLREGALRELAKRENRGYWIRIGRARPLTPMSYAAYYI